MSNKIIYADNSATTKVREEVISAMNAVFRDDFGNPSSIHQYGRKAKLLLTSSREKTALVINAKPEEIFFTSGGTESDNTVIFGIANSVEEKKLKKSRHIITSSIEHPAIKAPLEYLEKKGWQIIWLPVDNEGFIDLKELESAISPQTALVSIIHANNEIGTIQDLKKITSICKKNDVLFHTDAVQSFGKIPIDVQDMNIDFLSVSSHKIYGPKGAGALYIKDKNKIAPLIIGGGQENNLRSGTENLPGIAGFSTAAYLLKQELLENSKRLRKLQITLMEKLLKCKKIIFTGAGLEKVKENIPVEKFLYRIPGHVSFCVQNTEGENLVLQADLRGIAISSGSACSSKDIEKPILEPSHILKAIKVRQDYIKGSLRITLGRENTEEDVSYISETIKTIINSLVGASHWDALQ